VNSLFLKPRVAAPMLGVLAVAATAAAVAVASADTASASPEAASGWTLANGNLQGTRDVNSSISSSNVGKLGVAWSLPLNAKASAFGNYATTPVIVHGIVYTQDLQSNVYAVKLSTGKLLWSHKYNSPNIGPNGLAIAHGTVFGETLDRAFALQASTGEQLWSKKITRNKGEGIDMAPAYHNGTVYISTVPGNTNGFYTGNGAAILWAMNAKTGATKWKWDEVPPSLWGNKKVNSGGGQWQPPTFDAQGHLYLNVANPAPYLGDKAYPGKKVYAWGSSRPGKNLYTDSVVELNPANGKMIWYYQLTPHDVLDWDLNNQALITTVKGKEAIISAGKAGIAIANDAKTGKLLWKVKLGHRSDLDNADILAMEGKYSKLPKLPLTQWPGNLGGVESPYASDGSTVYMAVNNLVYHVHSQTKATLGNPLRGTGEMVAIDQDTGKVKWAHRFPHSPYGASTVTNDLVFTTTFDGTIWALNKATGKVVWKHALTAGTNAPLAINGDTVVLGAGYPEGKGQSASLVAFKIGATGSFTTTSSSSGSKGAKVDLTAGKSQFETTCSACHTLSEAGTHGTVGPNLDKLKPSDALVIKQVTNGGGGMPSFGGSLSKSKIADVAGYVSKVAGTGNDTLGGKTKKSGGGGAP
jgi:outer membrane protein assembly factor BamB